MMGTLLFISLVVILLVNVVTAACPSPTFVDSYSSLPSAPVFPTSYLSSSLTPVVSSSNPLTENHWSETSNLAKYRPPAFTPSSNPSQSNCPHLQSGLKNWHNPSTWPNGVIPTNNSNVIIPSNTAVLISSCSIDPSFIFNLITVPVSSKLVFADAPITINAKSFKVEGSLSLGSETCRLRNKITITLHGKRSDQTLPGNHWVKGIAVSGSIDIHGARYFPTWTRLAITAKPGDSYIFIQDKVNWQPGQRIVVTTTELKDSRDWQRNEERIIVSVRLTTLGSSVTAIQLDQPLSFVHYGGREYQAEVSLLSRNIVVQGDQYNSAPTDTSPSVCKDASTGSTYPCENSYLTGFGAHIIVHSSTAQGRFSGVEMYRVGQTNVLGRYPIHFHLIGNVTNNNYETHYVKDSAVRESYFRCYAIHGTSGVLLTENTAHNAIGHCYFLEDGVEENNIISYNQASYIHPLGQFWNPSINANGDNWWLQYLATYSETPNLILPSDMAAGCFYITNTYNNIFGNAASGGWAGFSIPTLRRPVKLHNHITNVIPGNRPFQFPFRGNSAHSTGFWWQTAGGLYVGGELSEVNGVLRYTSGRSLSRDTCSNPLSGTPLGEAGCWTLSEQRWLRFEDNKVFLSNRGMQHWGQRSEIIRFEIHDVNLAMNVFGKVWIDSMLMQCRSPTHRVTWMSGCPASPTETRNPTWGLCNVRDYNFFNSFGGFTWYDVSQQHILTNTVFRNCREDWNRCVYGTGGNCSKVSVFNSLTHSDQFVPEVMQTTSNVTYQNVSNLWAFSTQMTDVTGITVAGRLQNWYDFDGSASNTGVRTMLGSSWANSWWKYNDNNCRIWRQMWICKMDTQDSSASILLKHNATLESQIGGEICINGAGTRDYKPCPTIGRVSHFGYTPESIGLSLGVNAKITGPLIAKSGGWFVRYTAGTPKVLNITHMQVRPQDVLLLAIPYPSGTTFSIYYQAPAWCRTTWAICRHDYRSVTSVSAVRSAFGDAYYWDNTNKLLYLRVVRSQSTFGSPGTDKPWTSFQPDEMFTRAGHTLITPTYQASVIIESSCSSNPCAPQPSVAVPNALF